MKKLYVSMAVVALAFVFVGRAVAADWNFYGSARMTTFYTNIDKEANGTLNDDTDLTHTLQGNSRIGATMQSGSVGGGFEYGTGVNVRKLFGTWNFGSGELLVGQTYTPVTLLLSNQVYNGDNGLLNGGEFYAGRQPMLQLKFAAGMGDFKFALVSPTVAALTSTTVSTAPAAPGTVVSTTTTSLFGQPGVTETDVTLPKIELSYRFKGDAWFAQIYSGYQTYDAADAADNGKAITSYVVGLGGAYSWSMVTLKANIYTAQNPTQYGATTATAGAPAGSAYLNPVWNGTDYEDASNMGGLLMAGFSFNDILGLELGIGYSASEVDVSGIKTEKTVMTYYVQLPITLADGVFIVPEVGNYDFGDLKVTGATDTKLGSQMYYGFKTQINF